jgi:hypothetical protein
MSGCGSPRQAASRIFEPFRTSLFANRALAAAIAAGANSGASRFASSAAARAGEQHGAAAVGCFALDLPGGFLRLDQLQGGVPLATLGKFLDSRLGSPGQLGCRCGRPPGIMACGIAIPESLGLQVETPQAQQSHFRIVQHRLEFRAGRLVIPLEQRGLCIEQVNQRLLVRTDELCRLLALPACQGGITGAGSDHASRKCLVAAVAPAGAKMPRNGIGAVPERLQQPPCDHRCGHDGDHRHCRDHEAHLVLVAIEGDDDFARPVRKPRKAKGKGEDDEKEEQDTDHGRLPALLNSSSRWR